MNKIKWEANWSKVPHFYFRRFLEFKSAPTYLVPGHLVPEHLVPGHLVPGHLVPGHLVRFVDKILLNLQISSKNSSREWCYKKLCYNRKGPCLRSFRRSNCYWVVYQLWTDFVSTQKIFYLRSPLHCSAQLLTRSPCAAPALLSSKVYIELMINKARHEFRIVNTARWP